MKESQRKGLISVHVAVALFGFVGLFAKLVDLPAVIIVLGRVFFSSIFLWIFLRFKKQKIRLEEKSDYRRGACAKSDQQREEYPGDYQVLFTL